MKISGLSFSIRSIKNTIKFLDFVQGHRINNTLTFLEVLLPLEYHIVVDVWRLVKKEVHEVDRETYGRWTFNLTIHVEVIQSPIN